MKKTRFALILPAVLTAAAALILSIGIGSVWIPPDRVLAILRHALTGVPLPASLPETLADVLIEIRIPRAFCAFLVGGMLSVAGAVMQSLLQNPLASSYTLGVSGGASLGAAIVVTFELTLPFLLPLAGFSFALATMLFVLTFASRLDRNMKSHTVILLGMVVTMFMSALVTMVCTLNPAHMNRVLMWQMGSFAGRRWYHAGVLAATALVCILLLIRRHRELDILSFGDDASLSIGVRVPRIKRETLALSSLMTGVAVCFTGTVGFVDLIVPHVVRRLCGPAHRLVLPLSFVYGGAFLALTDTLSRTVLSPRELPVGAVTALFGTPFFLYLYFGRRKG